MLKRAVLFCVFGLAAFHTSAFAQAGFVSMVDHLHLGVPDPAAGAAWYHKYLDGMPTPEGPERVMFGQTRMIFQMTKTPLPSSESVLYELGFSVKDLDRTMKTMQADGVNIVTPARALPGLYKAAVIEDPWGTRIALVQDSQRLGLHHIVIHAPDPATALAWYADKFGGKPARFKGKIDGIDYGGVWLLAERGDSKPSQGHAIDHIGFRPINVDAAVVALKAKNVKVLTEPRPLTLASGTTMRLAFIEGPEGIRIEMVQRDNLK